jgi:uncharacterized repeat protein (TIGR03833 family)
MQRVLGMNRSNIKLGATVNIVQKHHQRTGELTSGIVEEILTNSANHPHGIKVRLINGPVGRVQSGSTAQIIAQPEVRDSRLDDPPRSSASLASFLKKALDEKRNDGPVEQWACKACSFENAAGMTLCEMCGGRT